MIVLRAMTWTGKGSLGAGGSSRRVGSPHGVGRMLLAVASMTLVLVVAAPAQANNTPQTLPFSQNWSNAGLITTNNNWSNVPGIVGYRGDDLTTSLDTSPQNITADGSGTPQSVIANQSNPNTLATGGVAEFDGIPDRTVALQGSSIADAPHLVFYLNTTGFANIDFSTRLRDIDGSADDAVQQVALQYRVGNSGTFQNVSYVGDATTGPNLATQETTLSGRLGTDASNQPEVQVRVITTNATGNDEWVGVDDVSVTGALPLDSLKISEFRTSGASSASDATGLADEFVEMTNRSQQTIDISNVLVNVCGGVYGPGSGPVPFTNIGGSLAPGQSLLAVTGNAYTGGIDSNKTPDTGYFGYGNPGGSSEGYTLSVNAGGAVFDKVGAPGSPCAEGAGLTMPTAAGNYSFVRRAGFNSLPDTNDNAADFDFVSDTAGTFGSVSALGLPGPENANDPRRLFSGYQAALFSGTNANASPNRTYDATDSRGTNGVLRIRRTFTNTGSLPIQDLRFRIYLLNTKNSPPGTARADLRAVDSTSEVVATRNVAGTTVEGGCPAAEPECHGLNTRVQVDLTNVADQLAPGASIDFSLDLAVQRTGSYIVAFFPEAKFSPPPAT